MLKAEIFIIRRRKSVTYVKEAEHLTRHAASLPNMVQKTVFLKHLKYLYLITGDFVLT